MKDVARAAESRIRSIMNDESLSKKERKRLLAEEEHKLQKKLRLIEARTMAESQKLKSIRAPQPTPFDTFEVGRDKVGACA